MERQFFDIEQNTPEWLELRKGLITGTKFTKLMMGKTTAGYKNQIVELALERLGIDYSSFIGNGYTDMGHVQEPLMREQYEIETLNDVTNGGFFKLGDWMGVSPDGLIGEDGLWENKAKTSLSTLFEAYSNFDAGLILTEKSNKDHFWQVHYQLYVTDRDWCDYQTGRSEFKPIIQRIYRDENSDSVIESVINTVIPEIEKAMKILTKYKL